MTLPELKQLDKLIALCRKRGVRVIKIDNMELTLSDDLPTKPSKKSSQPATTGSSIFETDSLTDEQLLTWSVTNIPGEVPGAQDDGGSA